MCVCVPGTLPSRVHAAEGPAQLLGLNPSRRRQLTAPLQHQQQRGSVLPAVWKQQRSHERSSIPAFQRSASLPPPTFFLAGRFGLAGPEVGELNFAVYS